MVITLNEFKNYLGIPVANTEKDIKHQAIVDFANDYITKYCNTTFQPTIKLGEIVSNTCNIIVLPNAPVISIESFQLRATDEDVTDYLLDPEEGTIEIIDGTLPTSDYAYTIDYTHGYVDPPWALQQAAFELVTYYDKREFNENKSFSTGESAQFAKTETVPAHVRMILDMYKVL